MNRETNKSGLTFYEWYTAAGYTPLTFPVAERGEELKLAWKSDRKPEDHQSNSTLLQVRAKRIELAARNALLAFDNSDSDANTWRAALSELRKALA